MSLTEPEIKTMLDTLADFQSQRDLMEIDKRNLLEEVKVPEEVQAIVSAGMKQIGEVEMSFLPKFSALREEEQRKLAAIVVPEEIKAALAEIDRQRAQVTADRAAQDENIRAQIQARKDVIQAEVDVKTQGVYAALAQRRAEIELEFSGKADAVDANIRKLTEQIKAAVKEIGFTISGKYYRAEYGKGRKSWTPQRLDKYTETHPDIKDCYTTGEASVAIKRINGR